MSPARANFNRKRRVGGPRDSSPRSGLDDDDEKSNSDSEPTDLEVEPAAAPPKVSTAPSRLSSRSTATAKAATGNAKATRVTQTARAPSASVQPASVAPLHQLRSLNPSQPLRQRRLFNPKLSLWLLMQPLCSSTTSI